MNRGWILKSIVCAMWHKVEKYGWLLAQRESLWIQFFFYGDWVTVSNHENLFPWAQVKEIDFSKNLAKVKWEISCTTDIVKIANLHPYSTSATSKQKRIKTDFFHHHNIQECKTTANDEMLCDKQTVLESLVPIQYYSLENTSKFCTEGSVKNLLNILRFSEHDVSVFWDLATASLHSIRACFRSESLSLNID